MSVRRLLLKAMGVEISQALLRGDDDRVEYLEARREQLLDWLVEVGE